MNDTTALATKVDALTKSVMDNNALAAKVEASTQRFDQFMLGSSVNTKAVMSFETCGVRYATSQYPIFLAPLTLVKIVDFVREGPRGPGNQYGNTYNPGWRNHLTFSWNQGQSQHRPPPPQGSQYQAPP